MRLAALTLLAALFLAPVLFQVNASLKPEGTALLEPFAPATDPAWANYRAALVDMGGFDLERPWRGFARVAANTVLIGVLSVIGQLLTCSLAGFAFARLEFRGREALFVVLLATMMLPLQVTVIPQFVLFQGLGWIDTILPLVAPSFLGGNAFFIFLFRQYYRTLPRDLFEAARLDGCSWWGCYRRIALPLSKPVLGAVAIFTFLGVWNDLWTPLIYLNSPEKQTLTLALAAFSHAYRVAVESLMAASTVILIPGLALYLVTQRLLLRGIQLGAGKG